MVDVAYGKYSYQIPYEWLWQRKVRFYEYPQEFFRLPDDPRPFVTIKYRTSSDVYRKKVYLSEMKFVGA